MWNCGVMKVIRLFLFQTVDDMKMPFAGLTCFIDLD